MAAEQQDWNTVVLRKNPNAKPKTQAALAAAKESGVVETHKKFLGGSNKAHAPPTNAQKLDAETEDFKHQRVTLEFKLALQQARVAKGWNQSQLAQAVAVKPSVINDYESGRAIPDGQLISKFNRVLGTVLPKIPKKKKETREDEQ